MLYLHARMSTFRWVQPVFSESAESGEMPRYEAQEYYGCLLPQMMKPERNFQLYR